MKKNMSEVLANREEILKKHIELDRRSINDPFLSQFMMGRVEVEESWLNEIERLLSSDIEPKSIMEILLNRRAILKSDIAESREGFCGIDGQKMRGKTAVSEHWLEETEILINSMDKETL